MKAHRRLILATVACAGALFGLFGWLRVIPSDGAPPGARIITQAPAWAANDPRASVYLGQGCFWHTQFDFVQIERDSGGPFARTAHADVTALVGYAGGAYEGRGGAVCYHGDPELDYSTLGHAQAVSVRIDGLGTSGGGDSGSSNSNNNSNNSNNNTQDEERRSKEDNTT